MMDWYFVAERTREGARPQEIADELDASVHSVYRAIRRMRASGVLEKGRPQGRRPVYVPDEKLIELWHTDKTITALARETGLSRYLIHNMWAGLVARGKLPSVTRYGHVIRRRYEEKELVACDNLLIEKNYGTKDPTQTRREIWARASRALLKRLTEAHGPDPRYDLHPSSGRVSPRGPTW
jgi:Homeodomain-like domain-containing protein